MAEEVDRDRNIINFRVGDQNCHMFLLFIVESIWWQLEELP